MEQGFSPALRQGSRWASAPEGITSVAKAEVFFIHTAGLEGLLHPLDRELKQAKPFMSLLSAINSAGTYALFRRCAELWADH